MSSARRCPPSLAFPSDTGRDARRSRGDRVHDARIQRPVGNQRSAALFRHADEFLLHRLVVDVGEMDVEELHAADLLQLLLHPTAGFEGVFQAAPNGLLVVFLVRIEQLQQAGDCVLDGDRVPLVQVPAQLEILVDRVAEVPLPHLPQPFGEVVDDQAILVREELGPHLRDFPAGNVSVEAVEERGVDHRFGERGEEVACLDERIDGLVDVADEHHRGIGIDRVAATGERSRGHIVLHDLDAVLVLEGDARDLVEGHHVPEADQADLAAGHVVEQVRDGGLSAGNQDAVRADFLVDVALARAPRPKFGEVVVVLDQRDHAGQKVPLDPLLKVCWLHAGRTQQHVDPLLLR